MILSHNNGTSYYQFEKLRGFQRLCHAVFTRHNGWSNPPYHSLNVAFGLGDNSAHVRRNRSLIANSLGGSDLLFLQQVHGNDVAVIKVKSGDGAQQQNTAERVADALVTDSVGKFLVIQAADCQAVMLFDPQRDVIANIHAGWRGSIANIIGNTVATMVEQFGSQASQIIAGIGPSLGPCCAQFVHYRAEIPRRYWVYKNARQHFDFWAVSRDQLVAAGLHADHIEIGDICTKCRTDQFFSYRGEGLTGRFAAVIGLR